MSAGGDGWPRTPLAETDGGAEALPLSLFSHSLSLPLSPSLPSSLSLSTFRSLPLSLPLSPLSPSLLKQDGSCDFQAQSGTSETVC